MFARQVLNYVLYITGTDEVNGFTTNFVQVVTSLRGSKHLEDLKNPPGLPMQLLPMHILRLSVSLYNGCSLAGYCISIPYTQWGTKYWFQFNHMDEG